MKFIIGKKIGMSQIFIEDEIAPVTLVSAGPVLITKIKSATGKDAYSAICLRYGQINKEIRLSDEESAKNDFKVDQKVTVDIFKAGDVVKAVGLTKGKGFQGVVKRHNFAGNYATHGHRHDTRAAGSIGSRYPQKTFKGKRMPGRMGGGQATVKGLKIVKVELEENLLLIKGALPGSKNSLIKIIG